MFLKLSIIFLVGLLKYVVITVSTRARNRNNVLYNLIANGFDAVSVALIIVLGVQEIVKTSNVKGGPIYLIIYILVFAVGAMTGALIGQKSSLKIEQKIKALSDAFDIKEIKEGK